jgi:hypothetical protein
MDEGVPGRIPKPPFTTRIPPMSRLLCLLFLLTTPLQAAPLELDILRQQYDKIHAERVSGPHETAVAELNAKFTAALDASIATAKQAGDLPTVLALEEDKKRLTEPSGLPIDTEETPEVLKKLRAIYREQLDVLTKQRDTNTAGLLAPYTARLQELEATLTKGDRIAEAKLVMEYRTGLQAGLPPAAATVSPPAAASAKGMPTATVEGPKAKGDDRKAAEWVLSVGGSVEIWESQVEFSKIATAAELPPGNLSLKSVLLDNKNGGLRPIADKDLLVLANLERLEYVLFQKLEITPAAFDVFQSCPALEQVTLQYNKLGDVLWPHLGALTQLRVVNQGYDLLPVTGVGITHLNPDSVEILGLTSSSIQDVALPEIGRFSNLTKLLLEDSKVTDAGMTSLSTLKKVTDLTVQGTEVSAAGLSHLKGAPLITLGYGRNMEQFTSEISEISELFPKLESVHLPRDVNPTTEEWQKIAQSIPKLTSLYVRSFKFSDSACEGIALLPKLAKLELQYAPITDVGVMYLSKMKNLRLLTIRDAILTDAALQTLSEMKNLKVLFLPNSGNGLTEAGIAALKKQRPDIEFR